MKHFAIIGKGIQGGIRMKKNTVLQGYHLVYDRKKYPYSETHDKEYAFYAKKPTKNEKGEWFVNGKLLVGVVDVVELAGYTKIRRATSPKSTRKAVYEKYAGRCAYCGKPLTPKQMRIDHIKPVIEEGGNEIENLRPSCQDCNHIKNSFDEEELRNSVVRFLDTIKSDIRYRMLLAYGLIQETEHEIKFLYEKEVLL